MKFTFFLFFLKKRKRLVSLIGSFTPFFLMKTTSFKFAIGLKGKKKKKQKIIIIILFHCCKVLVYLSCSKKYLLNMLTKVILS